VSSVFDHLDLIQEALQRSPFGLITDVDGTISQTAPTPQQARVSPACRLYLDKLCKRLALVAAISGRQASEVHSMLRITGMVYIGNHGLERWSGGHNELHQDARDYVAMIASATGELAPLLSIDGVSIENKGVTATIHYRLCPEPQLAEAKILKAVQALSQAGSLRVVKNRMAIDLLPPLAINKGTATQDLIREYHLQGGIYLGDARTDIDAFQAIHAAEHDADFRGFAIAVTSREMPAELVATADFTLDGVSDVENFLQWLSQDAPRVS